MSANNATYSLADLLSLMSRLRDKEFGCPWDLKQNYNSIVSSTLEEVYEVVDSIEQGDYVQLKEELGDLLFQVVFYSQLSKEEERFTFDDIVSNITEKLIRRHPHVFPDGSLHSRSALSERNQNQQAIKQSWEKIKNEERQTKGHASAMDDIPLALPAISRAVKIQKRAALANIDWPDVDGVYEKLKEETAELQMASLEGSFDNMEDELGDVLFTVVNLSRHLKLDPEKALRRANQKFEQRFRYIENRASDKNQTLVDQAPEVIEQWWDQAKSDQN